MKLMPREKVVGIFRGFSQGGLEFHADLVLPYRSEFQNIPIHGQFILVQLEGENEAVLGRITSISADGRLASGPGEDFGIRALSDDRPVPEDLREQYLKYRVDIRVLGVVRQSEDDMVFVPSLRRLPHVGSKVAFPSDEVLQALAGHNESGACLGHLAYGEFIYAGDDKRLRPEPWMQVVSPKVMAHFDVHHLVSRRSFVFARAGFGKSNLVKLLFSELYRTPPTIEKRPGELTPVGTIIFDPEGEYFWPDARNRPGLCDVPELRDAVAVFTGRRPPSAFYRSFVAGHVKLDIRQLDPSAVISIALSPEKQDQQNVRKLKGMNGNDWTELVNLINRDGNNANLEQVKKLLKLSDKEMTDAEAMAARSNMSVIVRMLHDPHSRMLDAIVSALGEGKLCIVDVSHMKGTPALILSGLILHHIFDHNQTEFTMRQPHVIPAIAVVEEAQAVLGSTDSSGDAPYVSWVKEGRKYDLGAVMITQQPGSISQELLSQGDSWFVFHLLSSGDLTAVKKANAHFSDDILSSLLNEPIRGHCVFWSSTGGRPYPLSIRVLSFEDMYSTPLDPHRNMPAQDVYAGRLRKSLTGDADYPASPGKRPLSGAMISYDGDEPGDDADDQGDTWARQQAEDDQDAEDTASGVEDDFRTSVTRKALDEFTANTVLHDQIRSEGMFWWDIQLSLMDSLPRTMTDKKDTAYSLVPKALNQIFGERGWRTEKRPDSEGRERSWVIVSQTGSV